MFLIVLINGITEEVNMSEQTILELAESIEAIINNNVDHIIEHDKLWKPKYEELVYSIKHAVKVADEWLEDAKKQGLTIGLIEAEGYARAVKEMQTWIEE